MKRIVFLFDGLLEKISRLGLISSLYVILALAVTSIGLRWGGISPSWMEPLIRHLVFLSAFLGGSLATSKKVHIKVDLMERIVNASSSRTLAFIHQNVVCLFCLVTTLVLTKASIDFYGVEREFGSVVFLNLHSSMLVAIIPFGTALICLRFFNQLLLNIIQGELSESSGL